MHILQLCPKPPFPPVDGGALAMHAVTEGFLHYGNKEIVVKVLAIETEKHPFSNEKLSADYKAATGIETVFIDTEVKILPAFVNLFSSSSYNVDRFYSVEFEKKLVTILKENKFDIIQLESIFVTPYLDTIRKMSNAKVILRAHNVESEVWKRNADEEKNVLKRKWFLSLSEKLYKYEKEIIRRIDALVPITHRDAEKFVEMLEGTEIPIHVLPYAMKFPEQHPMSIPGKNYDTVLHIGAMDWNPNIEGVKWLVNEVWPKVLKELPEAELHLAGKNLKKDDGRYIGTNIFNHGQVENAMDFMDRYNVMTVPLHSGGGMRVKLLEGFFLNKPIVTTSIGAEGYDVQNGVHVLIADSAHDFAKAIIRALTEKNLPPLDKSEPMLAGTLAKNALAFSNEHELGTQTSKLIGFYNSLLS